MICGPSDPWAMFLRQGCEKDQLGSALREDLAALRPGLDQLHRQELKTISRDLADLGARVMGLRRDLEARAETSGTHLDAAAQEPNGVDGKCRLLQRWAAKLANANC